MDPCRIPNVHLWCSECPSYSDHILARREVFLFVMPRIEKRKREDGDEIPPSPVPVVTAPAQGTPLWTNPLDPQALGQDQRKIVPCIERRSSAQASEGPSMTDRAVVDEDEEDMRSNSAEDLSNTRGLTEAQVQRRVRRQAVRDTQRSEMKEAPERDLQQHAAENRELRSIMRARSQHRHATPSMPWPDARDWVHQTIQNFKFTVQGISEAGGLMQWRDMQTWLKNLICPSGNTISSR